MPFHRSVKRGLARGFRMTTESAPAILSPFGDCYFRFVQVNPATPCSALALHTLHIIGKLVRDRWYRILGIRLSNRTGRFHRLHVVR